MWISLSLGLKIYEEISKDTLMAELCAEKIVCIFEGFRAVRTLKRRKKKKQ